MMGKYDSSLTKSGKGLNVCLTLTNSQLYHQTETPVLCCVCCRLFLIAKCVVGVQEIVFNTHMDTNI